MTPSAKVAAIIIFCVAPTDGKSHIDVCSLETICFASIWQLSQVIAAPWLQAFQVEVNRTTADRTASRHGNLGMTIAFLRQGL